MELMEEDLMQESMMAAENEFYNKDFKFSYSSLSKLLWNPIAFYQIYVMGIREETTTPSLTNGKVIHALLLSENLFEEQFIISPDNLPTGNNKTVVDRVFSHYTELSKNGDGRTMLSEYSDAIIDVLADINLHQTLKTDQQRLDKIITPETINYWEFLKSKNGKQLIDQETYRYCLGATDMIRNSPELTKLMGLNVSEFDNIQVFNEHPLEKVMEKYPFGLKGILDNIVINHDEKVIYINDLKTTSKDLKDFPDSIEYYSYWMQATIYIILVYFNFMELIMHNLYQVKFNFVVIDKNFMTYAFPLSAKTQEEWLERFQSEVLVPANYHYTQKKYELPYKFCTKQIIL
jgi:hypothetical protein